MQIDSCAFNLFIACLFRPRLELSVREFQYYEWCEGSTISFVIREELASKKEVESIV
jgi:hypothetical protein